MATKFSSPLEVGARFTSGFSLSRRLFGKVAPHAGTDWAPKVPGSHVPIHSVADGVVVAAGTGVLAGHTGQIVVVDHGILTDGTGSDHTITNYGHMYRIDVRKGQKVKAGQQLGLTGATGNVTGVHLHLGVRFNGRYYDPKPWLERKGIVVGKTAPLNPSSSAKHVATTAPKATTAKLSTAKHVTNVKTIQKRLKAMGYSITVDGKDGSETRKVIQRYQSEQKAPFTLVADGQWGNATEKHYSWVIKLQKAINKWKSKYRALAVDGHYGANTVARVTDIMTRNHNGAYKGKIDGKPGSIFCKMVGIPTHP